MANTSATGGVWTGANGETIDNATDDTIALTNSDTTSTIAITFHDFGDTDDDDMAHGSITVNCTDVGTGAENCDVVFRGVDGGVETTFLTFDGSAANANTRFVGLSGGIGADEIANDIVDGTELADTIVLDATLGITSGAAEGIAMTHAMTNDTAEVAFNLAITASDTSPSTTGQYGLYIDNVASTEGLDAAIVIDNSDADDAVIAGILFVDAGGGFTNAIDTAGGNITTGAAHITAQMPVVSLASGALTLNTIHLATAGGADYDIPDSACDAAADLGNWVTVVLEDASVVVSITSDDASNIFTVPGLGALTAGNELDSVSHTVTEGQSITLTCLTAENWYFTGGVSMHTDATIAWADGGTAD
jgi:hypothetical protein